MQSCLHLGKFYLEGTLLKTNIIRSAHVIMSRSLHVLWSDPRLSSHGGISWKTPYLPQGGNLGSIYVFFVVDKKITNGQLIFQDYSNLLISMVNFKTLTQMKTCFLNIFPLILKASRGVNYKRPKVNRLVPVWKFRPGKFLGLLLWIRTNLKEQQTCFVLFHPPSSLPLIPIPPEMD